VPHNIFAEHMWQIGHMHTRRYLMALGLKRTPLRYICGVRAAAAATEVKVPSLEAEVATPRCNGRTKGSQPPRGDPSSLCLPSTCAASGGMEAVGPLRLF